MLKLRRTEGLALVCHTAVVNCSKHFGIYFCHPIKRVLHTNTHGHNNKSKAVDSVETQSSSFAIVPVTAPYVTFAT